MKPGKMAGKVLPLFSSPLKAEEAIVTGNKTGTYYAIGEDLSKFVMPELKELIHQTVRSIISKR